MTPTEYKKTQLELFDRLRKLFKKLGRIFSIRPNRRFTMMVIPHSERGQIFNFQISLFSLIFIFFVILLPIVGFLILAGYFPAQKASLSLTSYTIEKRIEIAKQTLKQLETEKAEIDNVLKSDRKVVNSIYGNQIRLISQLIGNNFIWGYISGVLSSITGYYLTILLSRIFSKRKVPSK